MGKKNISKVLMMVVMTTLTVCGCEYKDIGEYPVNRYPVMLHFDWSNVDSIPKQMRVGLYPMDNSVSTGAFVWLEVGNRDTIVYAPEGSWRMTAWNRDVTHVVFQHYGWRDSLNVTATDPFTNFNSLYLANVLDSIFPNHVVKDYPDYMVHDNQDVVNVKQDMENVINVKPERMVTAVNITAHGIKGLDIVKMTKGVLSNIRGKRYIAYPNKTEEDVTVLFDAKSHPDEETVTATFWVFGIEPQRKHRTAFFFYTSRGQAFFDMDVTDLVNKEITDGSDVNIDIYLDFDLRKILPMNDFDINIDEWTDEWKPIGF